MKRRSIRNANHVLAILLAGFLSAGPALAEKPDSVGNGKNPGKSSSKSQNGAAQEKSAAPKDAPRGDSRESGKSSGGGSSLDIRVGAYFGDSQRTAAQSYYRDQFRSGSCPPGLAKKNNGCLPPGQAKKWAIGKRLPSDVIYYSVPQGLVVQLGVPPSGHRYVRVAADILLIAIGTGMVVDAIQDLGSM